MHACTVEYCSTHAAISTRKSTLFTVGESGTYGSRESRRPKQEVVSHVILIHTQPSSQHRSSKSTLLITRRFSDPGIEIQMAVLPCLCNALAHRSNQNSRSSSDAHRSCINPMQHLLPASTHCLQNRSERKGGGGGGGICLCYCYAWVHIVTLPVKSRLSGLCAH